MLVHKLIQPGRIIFALGILSLGVLQFFAGDYILGRPPLPAWLADIPGKLVWAYVSGVLVIMACLAILLHKKAAPAALFIAALFIVCSFLLRHLPVMAGSFDSVLWTVNAYKSLGLAGGALIVAASFFKEKGRTAGYFFASRQLVITGSYLLALFFIICGLAHFKFDQFVFELIPAYLPWHPFWTYFAAIALFAAAAGLIWNKTRQLAALLSGIMILLWFVMLHIPRAIADVHNYSEWMGVFESFAFSGILFVLTGILSKRDLSRYTAPSLNIPGNAATGV